VRVELEKLNGKTIKFTGVLDAKGKAYIGHKSVKTYCIVNICDYETNKELTNHCWVKTNKLDTIKFNAKFSFVATVESYLKRVNGQVVKDYCLTNIKYVKLL
jgi:hypothetical protein